MCVILFNTQLKMSQKETRIRNLLPTEWLVEPQTCGTLRWVAAGNQWTLFYDTERDLMLLSLRRCISEWTSMSTLNLHLRLTLMQESNNRFLEKLDSNLKAHFWSI
mgnify:CR=1 FL=1